MKSETIGTLAKALSQAQSEMKAAELNATNPFLKNRYADLGSVIEAARQPLAKNGLSFSQLVTSEEGRIGLETMLLHNSGEWLSSTLYLPYGDEKGKSLAQAAGSVITYLRRYALSAILGVYAGDDDDGTEHKAAKKQEKAKEISPELGLEEAQNVTSKDGRRYGDIPADELRFHLKGITDGLASGSISDEKRAELLRKKAAASLILGIPEAS